MPKINNNSKFQIPNSKLPLFSDKDKGGPVIGMGVVFFFDHF